MSTDLKALYAGVMGADKAKDLDTPGAFTLRLWDGMDGCWVDIDAAKGVSLDVALAVWAERTKHGTVRVSFNEIDYYRIFEADTRMKWDGSPGREMFRQPDPAGSKP